MGIKNILVKLLKYPFLFFSEWDDHRSDHSEERSAKRPRTPLESPVPPPPSESPASELGGGGGRMQVLPPPILSDEMEAISDNEDIPDLPAEDEAPEFGEEHVEEEDQLVVVAAPIEESMYHLKQ